MSNAPQTGQFFNVDALARLPDAGVIVVDEILRPDVDRLFPSMAVLGVKGAPKAYEGLRGRNVYVWAIDPNPKLPALAEVAEKLYVVRGTQSPAAFLGNPGRIRAHVQANREAVATLLGAAEKIVEPEPRSYVQEAIQARSREKPKMGVVDADGTVRLPKPDNDTWAVGLLRNSNGSIKPNVANAIIALRGHPAWQGVLAFNAFAMQVEPRAPYPWGGKGPWNDTCDTLTANWLQHEGINVASKIAAEAVETVARDNAFHPVCEYLNNIVWDKVPRLEKWLITYVGAEDNDYTQAAGRVWLISAIARIRQPGIKADLALFLEGPQGALKSTVFDVLGGEWFTDDIESLGTKDAAMQAMGAWIIEMSELDAMTRRSDISAVKAFLARRVDRIRLPYGRRIVQMPRHCVFGGTFNPGGCGMFKDETGNRRFLPVRVGTIDIEGLRRDRDQLFAEADMRWANGEPHWITDERVMEMARAEQEARREHDAWEGPIEKWLESKSHRDFFTMQEILSDCFGLDIVDHGKAEQRRAGSALRVLGLDDGTRRIDGKMTRGWKRIVQGVTDQQKLDF